MPERNNYRGKKLVIIIWNYIIKIWGIRNEEAQQAIQLQRWIRETKSKNHKVYKVMNKLKQQGEIDQGWVTRDDDEIAKIH